MTAWAALYGVFFHGGMLEYRQKKNRPMEGGLSYFVSLRISTRTANGKAMIKRRIIRYHLPQYPRLESSASASVSVFASAAYPAPSRMPQILRYLWRSTAHCRISSNSSMVFSFIVIPSPLRKSESFCLRCPCISCRRFRLGFLQCGSINPGR